MLLNEGRSKLLFELRDPLFYKLQLGAHLQLLSINEVAQVIDLVLEGLILKGLAHLANRRDSRLFLLNSQAKLLSLFYFISQHFYYFFDVHFEICKELEGQLDLMAAVPLEGRNGLRELLPVSVDLTHIIRDRHYFLTSGAAIRMMAFEVYEGLTQLVL